MQRVFLVNAYVLHLVYIAFYMHVHMCSLAMSVFVSAVRVLHACTLRVD